MLGLALVCACGLLVLPAAPPATQWRQPQPQLERWAARALPDVGARTPDCGLDRATFAMFPPAASADVLALHGVSDGASALLGVAAVDDQPGAAEPKPLGPQIAFVLVAALSVLHGLLPQPPIRPM